MAQRNDGRGRYEKNKISMSRCWLDGVTAFTLTTRDFPVRALEGGGDEKSTGSEHKWLLTQRAKQRLGPTKYKREGRGGQSVLQLRVVSLALRWDLEDRGHLRHSDSLQHIARRESCTLRERTCLRSIHMGPVCPKRPPISRILP